MTDRVSKCRLDLQSFLPRLLLIDTTRYYDAMRAREVCAGVQPGEIILFNEAYMDFGHLSDLFLRGVFWVTRTRTSHRFKVVNRRKISDPKILADEEVILLSK